jgi:hypothetical protein
MKNILLPLAMLLSLSTEAFAQHAGTDQDEKACTRDVQRLCRKFMDQGDFVVSGLPEGKSYPAASDLPRRADQTRAIAGDQ